MFGRATTLEVSMVSSLGCCGNEHCTFSELYQSKQLSTLRVISIVTHMSPLKKPHMSPLKKPHMTAFFLVADLFSSLHLFLCIRSDNAEKCPVVGCHDHDLNTDRKRLGFFNCTEILKEGI